jgi:hypothetical protein
MAERQASRRKRRGRASHLLWAGRWRGTGKFAKSLEPLGTASAACGQLADMVEKD